MNFIKQISSSPEETMELAGKLASRLQAGDVIFLEGELAAGKTVFARGLIRALRGDETEVSSPTFVILQSYECSGTIRRVHHLDLYRLHDESLESIGLEEILAENMAVAVIEWPDERVLALMARKQRLIRVRIIEEAGSTRLIMVETPT